MYLTHFGDCFSKVLYLEGDVNSCYAIVIPDATKINFLELMSKLYAIYSLPLIYVQHLRTCSDKFSSHHGNEVAKISIGLIFKVKRILNRCYDSMSHSVNTKTLKCRLKNCYFKIGPNVYVQTNKN